MVDREEGVGEKLDTLTLTRVAGLLGHQGLRLLSLGLGFLVGADGLLIDLGEEFLVLLQLHKLPRCNDVMAARVIDSVGEWEGL